MKHLLHARLDCKHMTWAAGWRLSEADTSFCRESAIKVEQFWKKYLKAQKKNVNLLKTLKKCFFLWIKGRKKLTIMPPPMTPPMYFTSSVIFPSLTYLVSPAGKKSTMLQMMEMTTSGYRPIAMKREHFPVHMLSSCLKIVWGSCSQRELPPETEQKQRMDSREVCSSNVRRLGVWLQIT